jgi:GSH-dependent disulfide-bond oxidoreductase
MIELHTTPTANGYKASIMLEETGLPYEVTNYDLVKGEHLKPHYLAMNPVGRMPMIVDHDIMMDSGGAGGKPLTVYGTTAIVLYLADKSRRFMPHDAVGRAHVYEWLGIVSSDIAPAYSGQFVFNVIAPEKQAWAREFYDKLCLRMLAVMEQQLGRTEFLAGAEYTIADVLAYPVAAVSMKRFPGDLSGHPNIARWAQVVGSRPAVQRGMKVPC